MKCHDEDHDLGMPHEAEFAPHVSAWPELADPVTRRRFADSFAPGYFG